MTYHHAIRLLAIAVFATVLAACGEQQHSTPATKFNQQLTDEARRVSNFPGDVEKVQCWAEQRLVGKDRVFCNVFVRGRSAKDVGSDALGWEIPVFTPGRLSEVDRYLSPSQFDLPLLASTKFLLVANNDPQGLSIEVAADETRVPLVKAQDFLVAVLPEVSEEMSRKLKVRYSWSDK